jgi:hypothetical protein
MNVSKMAQVEKMIQRVQCNKREKVGEDCRWIVRPTYQQEESSYQLGWRSGLGSEIESVIAKKKKCVCNTGSHCTCVSQCSCVKNTCRKSEWL